MRWAIAFGSLLAGPSAQGDQIGIVAGARYDEATGRVWIVGDGTYPEASPPLHILATAFRWVFADEPRMPYVSIDPVPGNPTGPFMAVDIDPVSQDTEFGWIMFEADRKLKCLGAGRDNVYGYKEDSAVPGFRNLLDLKTEEAVARRNGEPVWSRFWFVPQASDVQWDGEAMRIADCRLGVKTEIMTLVKGELRTSNGLQDPGASAFAAHFTEHYREFGQEQLVFLQLEQQCRLLLIAEWLLTIRDARRPLSVAWVRSAGGPDFLMPRYTPTVRATKETSSRVGEGVIVERVEIVGGVDLKVKANLLPLDAKFQEWKRSVAALGGIGLPAGSHKPKGLVVLKMPDASSLDAGAKELSPLLRVSTPGGSVPVLTRQIVTGRNRLTGRSGRELALPHLFSFRPKGIEGEIGKIGIKGADEADYVEERHYEVVSSEGQFLGFFDHHEVEPFSGAVLVKDSRQPQSPLYLTPDSANRHVMWLVDQGVKRLAFSLPSGEIIAQREKEDLLLYGYGNRGVVKDVRIQPATGGESRSVVSFGQDASGSRMSDVRTADGQMVSFRSETRAAPEGVSITAYNEVVEKFSLHFDPSQGAFQEKGGKDLHTIGLTGMDLLQNDFLRNLNDGPNVFHFLGVDGQTLVSRGSKLFTLPSPYREFERAVAKLSSQGATGLTGGMLDAVWADLDPGYSIVPHERRSTRWTFSNLASQSRENHFAISSENPERAQTSIRKVQAERNVWRLGENVAAVQLGTLPPAAREVLEPVLSADIIPQLSPKDAAALAIFAHNEPGTRDEIARLCRENPGKPVLGLLCNTEESPEASQTWADEMVRHGALIVVVPAGFLDAADAAKIAAAMSAAGGTPQNLLEWFYGIVTRLALRRKFGPSTADLEDGKVSTAMFSI